MSKFIIDADAATGMSTEYVYDAADDQFIYNFRQDVSRIVEANKAEFNGDHLKHGDGLGRKVASIPLGLYFELRRKGIVQDRKRFARWLNDADNRVFRTSPGHI